MAAMTNGTVAATDRDAGTASTGNTEEQPEEGCSISDGGLQEEGLSSICATMESRHKVKPADGAAKTLNSIPRAPWIEPDWSQFEAPASVPSKLTILFVGVDNGSAKDPDLKLQEEYNNIEQAYRESHISHCKPIRVVIKRLYFSNWNDVMMEIRKEQPTILHFGCHAQKGTGIELFQQTVKPRQIVDAISSWNSDARGRTPPRPDIRLIVLNACESDVHALDLTTCVDFAIGHQQPVLDKDAVQFSRVMYDCIFDGATLFDSFRMAKGCADGYLLRGQQDPRNFRFFAHDEGVNKLKNHVSLNSSGIPSEASLGSLDSLEGVMISRSFAGGSSFEASALLTPPTPLSLNSSRILSQSASSSPLCSSSERWFAAEGTRDGEEDVCNQLTEYLKDKGFVPEVAARISNAMQVTVKHFLVMKRDDIDIDAEELSFLKRQHRSLLLALVGGTARSISLRDSADSDSDASTQAADESEASDSEDDLAHSIVAAYNLGNRDEIQAQLKMFLHVFMDENPLGEACGNMSLCTILWISFLKEATYLPTQVSTFERWMDRLFDGTSPIEDDMAKEMDSFVRDLVSHKLLGNIMNKMKTFSTRPCVASIAIIDQMVAALLVADEARLAKWNEIVVADWYDSPFQVPGIFLARANSFLRDDVGSVQLLACVQTQSCVAFLRMPRLAAHIFFEYLNVSKRKAASSAGAAESSTSLWHGFRLFVSNTRSMSSLTPAHVPARSALPTVRQGLECLARLPSQTWETICPVTTIKDLYHVTTSHSRSRDSAQGRIIYMYANMCYQISSLLNSQQNLTCERKQCAQW